MEKQLVRAVKPTLFEATFHPDLIFSVLLANLMSEKLEELGRHALHAPGPFSTEEERTHALHKLFQYLNGRFYHARPVDFARIWGLHERENIKNPQDLEANDYTLNILKNAYHHVGQFKPYAHLLSGFLDSGLFPEYVYPTVDVILKLSETLPPVANHPLGITSCADECILIASLAFIRHCCNIEDIIILGSPLHYILFLFPQESDGYLFNGKREFFTASTWRDTSNDPQSLTVKEAFISRIFTCDRLISAKGSWIFPLDQGSIIPTQLFAYIHKINQFLGIDLAALMPAIGSSLQSLMPKIQGQPIGDETRAFITELNQQQSREGIIQVIRHHAFVQHNQQAINALYTVRWTGVPHPEIYPLAALTGYKVWLLSAEILTLMDAIDLVRAIPGEESIYGDTSRIALPDEVLLFQTANGNERILLLYAFIKLSEALANSEKEQVTIVTSKKDWEVKTKTRSITTSDLK